MKMKSFTTLTLGLFVALASCSDEQKAADAPAAPAPTKDLSSVLLESAPADPMDIAEMRKTAKPGDTVTFTGTLIGDRDIFIENLAVMRMGDPEKLTACNLIPGDGCETPWDVCCDDLEVIKDSIVTVQVVDEKGRPLKSGLKGLGGLEELRGATVTGTVAETSTEDTMQVNATGIYVQPQS